MMQRLRQGVTNMLDIWALCDNPPGVWCSERCACIVRITPEKHREFEIQIALDKPMPEKLQ